MERVLKKTMAQNYEKFTDQPTTKSRLQSVQPKLKTIKFIDARISTTTKSVSRHGFKYKNVSREEILNHNETFRENL
jgi:hypothetical protein